MTPQQLGARPAPKPPAPLALPDRPLPPPLPVTPFLLHSQRALAQLARAPPSSMEAISAVVGKYDGVVGWIQWSLGLASDAPLPVYIYIKPHEHQVCDIMFCTSLTQHIFAQLRTMNANLMYAYVSHVSVS